MKIITFVALPTELPKDSLPSDVEIVYTGVGKVNAAMSAMKRLFSEKGNDILVVNYGSAGSALEKMRLYECTKFVQNDMNAGPLAPNCYTPFDAMMYPELSAVLDFGEGYTCATQDSFVTETPGDLLYDMESYSIAKVCKVLGLQFRCYKFVSDNGDLSEWETNHGKGVDLFVNKIAELKG